MSDSSFSLVDLKGISAPLTKLIESVSKGIGAIYEPTGKVRNAKAEAKAMLILADSKQKVNEITSRTYERIAYREIRRQNNIDSIVHGAIQELPETVSDCQVDEDWVVSFFEYSQDVSNSDMQQIWSKILAGEVSKPGSFKPRTLQVVKSLTVEEAKAFTNLCGFIFMVDKGVYIYPLLSDPFYKFIRSNGLSTDMETHLKNIGLLSHSIVYYLDNDDKNRVSLNYFSDIYYANPKLKDIDDDAALSTHPLTEIGNELALISGAKPNDAYIEELIKCGDLSPKI